MMQRQEGSEEEGHEDRQTVGVTDGFKLEVGIPDNNFLKLKFKDTTRISLIKTEA